MLVGDISLCGSNWEGVMDQGMDDTQKSDFT